MTTPEAILGRAATPLGLFVRFVDVAVRVETNDEGVWAGLREYYAPWVVAEAPETVATVALVQGPAPAEGAFADVERPDGRRVKEAVRDVPGGRLVLKRSTGVLMALWPGRAAALGDVRANLNQAINLVNACYAKTVIDRGYVLMHASGVSWLGRAVALAGPPGAGKSTAALHLVEDGFRFLSNDRVLARPLAERVDALGYPKQPRVNPGTLLYHRRLMTLLEPADRAALAALPPDELRALERKRDVDLDAIYGKGTIELRGDLAALVLLKWTTSGGPFRARPLTAAEALADLPLFYKDLGVFDLDRPARAPRTIERLPAFAALLERITPVEVTGAIDLPALADLVRDLADR